MEIVCYVRPAEKKSPSDVFVQNGGGERAGSLVTVDERKFGKPDYAHRIGLEPGGINQRFFAASRNNTADT